jgi:choline transport protein
MCEEIHNASTVVPQSILLSLGINGALGFRILIAVLYCLGNVQDAFNTVTEFSFIEIFQQATNSFAGSSAMVAIVLILSICSEVALLAAASRMMWAFARDRGLPGWWLLSKV